MNHTVEARKLEYGFSPTPKPEEEEEEKEEEEGKQV